MMGLEQDQIKKIKRLGQLRIPVILSWQNPENKSQVSYRSIYTNRTFDVKFRVSFPVLDPSTLEFQEAALATVSLWENAKPIAYMQRSLLVFLDFLKRFGYSLESLPAPNDSLRWKASAPLLLTALSVLSQGGPEDFAEKMRTAKNRKEFMVLAAFDRKENEEPQSPRA